MTDDQAILGCQSGDRNSFRHLVDRYKDVLYGTAFLMTSDRTLAEDQVQETLLSAWKGIRGFNRDRPFKPWLMRILVNVVLAHQRRRRVSTVPLGPQDHPDSSASPAESLEAIEDRREGAAGSRVLESGTSGGGGAALLCGAHRAPNSPTIRVQEGTVKSRLYRALGRLRQDLQEFIHGEVQDHGP